MKNNTIPKASEIAVGESIHLANKRKAEELYEKLFGDKYKNINALEVFLPSYHMCTLKETFYARGGNPLNAYSISDYSELLDIPEEYVLKLVEETPGFFIFLHTKRSLTEEVDILVNILARRLVNESINASVRDSAQALSVLSKFSSLVSPDKKKEPSFDDLVNELSSPEEVLGVLDTYGFTKKDASKQEKENFKDSFDASKADLRDSIPTIKELLDDED